MSGVGAVAGATAQEMDALREAALDAGAATVFSASEAAVAEAELVKAGVSVAEVLGGALTGSLSLAAAGQLDLGKAAEIAAQAMNIFKLEGDDVGYVADVLAAGANKSAADVNQLGDALRQGGLLAAQTGISLEETIGAFSLFADNALIGSDAGTSFKTMLQRLVPATGPTAAKMKELGLSFYDAEGNFVGLEEAAQRLQDSMKDLSEEERSLAMTKIFGSDAVRAANLLYEAGAAGIREYTSAVADEGAATRMAAEQLNNLKGDIEEFNGATETALIRVGELFDGLLRASTQGATSFVNVFNDFANTPAWDAIESNFKSIAFTGGDLFGGLADSLDDVLTRISPQDVNRVFRGIASALRDTRSAVDGLEPVIAGVGLAFSTMAARSVPFIGQLVPAISPITGLLGGLVLGSEEGRDALASLGREAADLGRSVGPQLTRPLAELADELSQGVASVLDDVGGAAIDAAEVLGPVLGESISELAPVIGDLIEAGGELAADVLPVLAQLAGDALPPAVDLLGGGLRLAAGAAELLSDNLWLLGPALGVFTAVKFSDQIGSVSKALGAAAGNAQHLWSSIGDVAATRGVSRIEALGGVTRATGREVGSLASGLAGALNPALVGVTAAVSVGALVYQNYVDKKREVREVTDRLVDALDEEASKFREMATANARQTLADKDALDTFNRLGISLERLTELSALHGDEMSRLDNLWVAAGGNADVFRAAIEGLPGPVREIGEQIAGMVDSGALENGDAVRFFQALDKLASGTADGMREAKAEFESIAREAAATGDLTASQLESFLERLRNARTPAEVNEAFLYLSGLLGGIGDAANSAEADVQRLNRALEDLAGVERDVDEAQREMLDSVQRALESFNRNGKGIDQNTEAGRRNADAIRQMVERTEELSSALARTDTTGKASSEAFNTLLRDLYALKEAGFLTAEEYQHLLDLYDLTPEEIPTKINMDISQAEAEMEEYRRTLLAQPGISEPQKAMIEAANSMDALHRVANEIDFVARPRLVPIHLGLDASAAIDQIPLVGNIISSQLNPYGRIPVVGGLFRGERASGGPVWPGTWLVGEKGPELLDIPSGITGHVTNAHDTGRILDTAASTAAASDVSALAASVDRLEQAINRMTSEPRVAVQYHQVEKAPDPDDLSRKLNRVRIGAY